MATAGDLINASLRDLGVLAAGETAVADDTTDALDTLNRMIDAWASERLMIHAILRTTWTIAANDGSYTVGAGGDVNIVRPVFVDHVNFQDTSLSSTTEFPLSLLSDNAWARIAIKTQTANYPEVAWYNPTFATAALELWPVPTSATLQGVLYSWDEVDQFSALTSTVTLPQGYQELIITNLAVRLAPSHGVAVHPELKERAIEMVARVKRANIRHNDLRCEAASLIGSAGSRAYDINTG